MYEFFMTENYRYYTLPGLFDNYEPRGITTLGTRTLLSLKAMGTHHTTASLFVLMNADEIVGVFRLQAPNGGPFNGSVTSVTVAGDKDGADGLVVWTVDGSIRYDDDLDQWLPSDMVVGYDASVITAAAESSPTLPMDLPVCVCVCVCNQKRMLLVYRPGSW